MKKKCTSTGFTMIELMIVVAIIGILASIAIISYQKYSDKAFDAEATSMLADIRIKQDAYRATFHQYFASPSYVPAAPPGMTGRNWPGNTAWSMAGLNPDNGLYFSYKIMAGIPGSTVPSPFDTAGINSANDFWYAARAIQDVNGDGICGGMEIYSGKIDIVELTASSSISCKD